MELVKPRRIIEAVKESRQAQSEQRKVKRVDANMLSQQSAPDRMVAVEKCLDYDISDAYALAETFRRSRIGRSCRTGIDLKESAPEQGCGLAFRTRQAKELEFPNWETGDSG